MKILLYEWESYLQTDIKQVFGRLGIQTAIFRWKFADKNRDEKFKHYFYEQIDTRDVDCIFSVNYWPLISEVAYKKNIKYIAWCYDNPLNVVRIEETLGNPNNRVIFFDRVQAANYIDKGFETVYYMPLAVNMHRLNCLQVTAAEQMKYACDVSLVGSLYESRLGEIKAILDEYSNGYIDAAMAVQKDLYGAYLLDQLIDSRFVENINDMIVQKHPDTKFRLQKEALTFAMASEITRKDRLLLLSLFANHFKTRLYSFQKCEVLKNVECLPPIDYMSEMPKVFKCSKINLNPSLRCIQSGIPLRALDIMGAGGFLLSNYQEELLEYFGNEEEMVVYDSITDAYEKAVFYLKNDDARNRIAECGRERIRAFFSMDERIKDILALIE